MIQILILEDNDFRIDQFKQNFTNGHLIFTKTAKECINYLQTHDPVDVICLDHDLGGQQMVESGKETGYEVAEWLTNNIDKLPKHTIYIHSLNPVGTKRMFNLLYDNNITSTVVPFLWCNYIIDFNNI